jgi:hypothetical protein
MWYWRYNSIIINLGSGLSYFTPGGGALSNHCMGDWMGPRDGLHIIGIEKTLLPLLGIEARFFSHAVTSSVVILILPLWAPDALGS